MLLIHLASSVLLHMYLALARIQCTYRLWLLLLGMCYPCNQKQVHLVLQEVTTHMSQQPIMQFSPCVPFDGWILQQSLLV